ncbi:MAG: PstA family ABC transporter permease, partial [Chthoniobacterales bacterium]
MTTADTPHFFHAAARGSLRRAIINRALNVVCVILAMLTFVPLISILYLLLEKGLPLLDWHVFTELPPAAGQPGGGFSNAVAGTLIMVGIAIAFATPFGVLSAIYVNEYAPNSKLAHGVRFVAKLLTGIPSIICGVFAYAVVVLAQVNGQPLGFSAMAGGFALAILTLPTIILTAEQALLGVSKSYREASYGLGATNFQTIWR